MSGYTVTSLLEKMNSVDKDFRFMATNDLMTELQRDTVKLDEETEKRMVRMLLQLLQDKNGEVQNLAVKCLGPLVIKVKNRQVETIVDTLCSNIAIENEQLRDISSIGLKTVISELPPSSDELINLISKKMINRLIDAITQKKDVTIQLEALDIVSDLLHRFGGSLVQFHEAILNALLPQLNSQRLAVRKRSITAISCLLVSGNQGILDQTLSILLQTLKNLSSTSNFSEAKSHIQAIACIARQVGHRFGDHLSSIVPMVQQFVDTGDDELKEYCIQAFESFVRRCPKEITPYIKSIIDICIRYIQHDPNYNYEDDEDDDEMEMDNEDDTESNDEYSDDDDMSWKVRRASAKCLEAIIATRIDMVTEFYQTISPVLISRFKEREENVKVEIFTAYAALLKQTRSPIDSNLLGDSMDQGGTAYALAQGQVKDIVKSLHKQLREKSIKTRQGAFMLLTDLITVMPSALHDDAAALIPGILFSLSDRNSTSNMKIDALTFLISFLKCNPPQVFQPHTQTLLPAIMAAVSDSFYKISSEALLVMTQMIKVIRPDPTDSDPESKFLFQPFIKPIYECTLVKLKANDIDQEVKERAITCMGQLISSCGDKMTEELKVTLPIFTDRLRNEITRLTCVKALINITSSPFKLDLSILLKEAFPILASFLRKFQRALKLSTLTLLDTICKNYGKYLDRESIEMILNEVPPLISESDLHVSQLTLSFLTSVTRSHSEMQDLIIVPQKIIPETLILVRSPLLQGAALQSVLDFFQALVTSSFPGLDHSGLVNQLTYPITSSNNPNVLHKQAFYSTARCIAAITVIDTDLSRKTVQSYLNQLSCHPCSDAYINFAFLVIGEIGKVVDLAPIHSLKDILMNALSSESPFSQNATEDVKSAASFALGSIAVGNLQEYLPFVLQEIENRNRRQYLLLHSLKEVISFLSANPASVQLLEPHLNAIWNMLLKHCECPEEGTRNVVAECLGKLTLMNPKVLLDQLRVYLKHQSPLARATVVTAIKFTISDHAAPIDSLLKSRIGEFFDALKDDDINVRRVALVTFNSAAHNKPSLIRDLLATILPHLYNETVKRQDLIREVEMGPFKHTVDDGLDIRKAAFECMYTLLDSCLDRIDIFEFLSHVENGLRDHYDIQMLTYLMLIRLSTLCPSAVLNRMDRLIEPLKVTCQTKVKTNAVKQECEKQDELKRSALRAFMALIVIPDADKNSLVNEFRVSISSNNELKTLFEQIQKDSTSSPNHNDVVTPMDIN